MTPYIRTYVRWRISIVWREEIWNKHDSAFFIKKGVFFGNDSFFASLFYSGLGENKRWITQWQFERKKKKNSLVHYPNSGKDDTCFKKRLPIFDPVLITGSHFSQWITLYFLNCVKWIAKLGLMLLNKIQIYLNSMHGFKNRCKHAVYTCKN